MARVLVIEDNRDNLELMRYLLGAFGHEALTAEDGNDGLAVARREHPDLVLCDIHLPGMDGYAVVADLKRDPAFAQTPAPKMAPAVVTHYNIQPSIDVYASVDGRDLGGVADDTDKALAPFRNNLPRGTQMNVVGQVETMTSSFEGQSVAVIGLGVSGQLHVQIAKARGAATVIGISRSAFKNDLAKQLGADLTIEAGPAAIRKVLDATDGRGADVVIECTGVMAMLADSIRMVRFGGRIILFGIMSAEEGALPFYDLYFKELTLINNRAATSEDFPLMIDLVARGAVRLEPLVTHHMALSELETALEMVEDGADRRLKIILDHT